MQTRNREQGVVVDHRFQGLPEVAHGGYVAGLIAGALGASGVEVRLRRPVPTGRRLDLVGRDGGIAELLDGETLLAEAASAAPSIEIPPPVSAAEAEVASRRFLGFDHHPAPGCVVCGPEREPGDGLRIFPGPVAGRRLVAAPWVPVAENGDAEMPPELVSAAFDCAQLWALIAHAPAGSQDLVLTAGLELCLVQPVLVGEPHVLVGWPIRRERRAWLAGAALFDLRGDLCAVGRQRAAIASWGVALGRATQGLVPQPNKQNQEEEMNALDLSDARLAGLADLKRAHRGTWASGSYATVAERLIDDVPPRHLLERAGIEPGMEVLDIATGTGNVAIKAAQVGARVTGLDLTPELFGRGRERAAEAGVEVEWVEGDAESLPFENARFDRVLSTFGIQFAPRHEVAAREAVRVARPGATIGLIGWTPQGLLGQVLKTVGSRLPKPPEFASPPPLWGDEDHVHALFADSGAEIEFERALNPIEDFASPEDWVEFMAVNYGPLLKARERLTPEGQWDELQKELVALTASFDRGDGAGVRIEAEYLLALVRLPTP